MEMRMFTTVMNAMVLNAMKMGAMVVGGAREKLLYREIRLSVLECEDGMTCL